MLNFGSDLSTFSNVGQGLDPTFTIIEGARVVLEACARRLMTPRGFFDRWPEYGYDLRANIGRKLTNVTRQRINRDIEAELDKDDRVRATRVDEWVDLGAGAYRIHISITLASGPTFPMVLKVSSLTLELLQSVKG